VTSDKHRPKSIKAVLLASLAIMAVSWVGAACGNEDDPADPTAIPVEHTIEIDGSSTVLLINRQVAEKYVDETPNVLIQLRSSGTGRGFQRFVEGGVDIVGASRAIEEAEAQLAADNGVEYFELKVAIDGIAIIAHRDNRVIHCLTVDELKRIWRPGSLLYLWSDIRPEWPSTGLDLVGPEMGSGTLDHLTTEIVGELRASRYDYESHTNQTALAQSVADNADALGYISYGHYLENRKGLRLVTVDAGQGCIAPTFGTLEEGKYEPLSRPLYIYVSKSGLKKPEVREFVEFYLEHAERLSAQAGFFPLPVAEYIDSLEEIGMSPE